MAVKKTNVVKKRVKDTEDGRKSMRSGRKAPVTGDVEVAEQSGFDGIWMSIHQFCRECRKDRAYVSRRISHGSIKAVKGDKGQALYRLGDLVDLIFNLDESGGVNIEKMDPFRKKAHYDSELGKMKLETQAGDLIKRPIVEQRFATVFQILSRFCDTLPDVLERDCGLNVTQIKLVENRLDATRIELHKAVNDTSEQQDKEAAA